MINPFLIMKEVEEYYFIPKGSICQQDKSKAKSEARCVAVLLSKKHTRFSWRELAEFFERDHKSLVQYTKSIKNRPNLQQIYNEIDGILTEKYL